MLHRKWIRKKMATFFCPLPLGKSLEGYWTAARKCPKKTDTPWTPYFSWLSVMEIQEMRSSASKRQCRIAQQLFLKTWHFHPLSLKHCLFLKTAGVEENYKNHLQLTPNTYLSHKLTVSLDSISCNSPIEACRAFLPFYIWR